MVSRICCSRDGGRGLGAAWGGGIKKAQKREKPERYDLGAAVKKKRAGSERS